MSRCILSYVASALFILGLVSTSYGAPFTGGELVNFMADPVSPTLDEIKWTGSNLVQGPGCVGNNDGTLSPDQQTPGGLNVQATLKIVDGSGNPYPGSAVNAADNSTTFYDVTLKISGLAAAGPPAKYGSTVIQYLGSGSFEFWSTGPVGQQQLLLSGDIGDDAFFAGARNTGSIQSSVTYTGGLIKDALVAAGGTLADGSLSWSLLDIGPGGVKISGGGLSAFGADMTGQFNAMPEPATLCLMGAGVAVVLVSRRKK